MGIIKFSILTSTMSYYPYYSSAYWPSWRSQYWGSAYYPSYYSSLRYSSPYSRSYLWDAPAPAIDYVAPSYSYIADPAPLAPAPLPAYSYSSYYPSWRSAYWR